MPKKNVWCPPPFWKESRNTPDVSRRRRATKLNNNDILLVAILQDLHTAAKAPTKRTGWTGPSGYVNLTATCAADRPRQQRSQILDEPARSETDYRYPRPGWRTTARVDGILDLARTLETSSMGDEFVNHQTGNVVEIDAITGGNVRVETQMRPTAKVPVALI